MESGNVYTYSSDFLGCYVVQTVKRLPTFRKVSDAIFIIN
jgi:hypothetical protein